VTIDVEGLAYRPCVGIMLLNKHGEVFVAQRIDSPGGAWQMPQGGIDDGETPAAAARRELKEETGTNKATIIAEHAEWIPYDLPEHLIKRLWKGRYRGQTQKWFVMRFLGTDGDIDINTAEPEFDAWRWVPMAELLGLVVPFKHHVYANLVQAFGHLAKAQDSGV
jgi:putative (di)nucleoside polyphosphate hydrolase